MWMFKLKTTFPDLEEYLPCKFCQSVSEWHSDVWVTLNCLPSYSHGRIGTLTGKSISKQIMCTFNLCLELPGGSKLRWICIWLYIYIIYILVISPFQATTKEVSDTFFMLPYCTYCMPSTYSCCNPCCKPEAAAQTPAIYTMKLIIYGNFLSPIRQNYRKNNYRKKQL